MKSMSNTHEHQFETADQQKEAATSGIWVFLLSEMMFFGAVFLAYVIYWYLDKPGFYACSQTLNRSLGTINTAVLLTSSWTMALAVHASEQRQRQRLLLCLALTLFLGSMFLVIKGFEWHEEYAKDLFPNLDPASSQNSLFFKLYFVMTGLHGLHLLIGLLLIGGLWIAVWRRPDHSPSRINFTENLGLYWHFVDIVWIFLFPLLYLLDQTGIS